ncbi:hypothetical protein PVK06_023443 [Gossypium arboreum]|uniref:Zinc knuckle CX2CX4HX4C domain-containing protein n=1 Tax=Gossypium arboreum TaxID=29729 RepID=A0ABR0PBB3_GOSAR|nr:hypothetical protein PVK06_023443 [Gossypium arboreum]
MTMEKDLVDLSLDDEEDEILQVQGQMGPADVDTKFCLLGCFMTASVIYLLAMRSTMENLWHPVIGAQISGLGEKREGEDPLKVPLIFAYFWIQIHEVSSRFRNEALARQLGDFFGNFVEYNNASLGRGFRNYLRVKVCFDVRHPLKRKKRVMFSPRNYGYVTFKYERLTLFFFFCGRLGHGDSFCQTRMSLGVKVAGIWWDLLLRTHSKMPMEMNSVWLKEE